MKMCQSISPILTLKFVVMATSLERSKNGQLSNLWSNTYHMVKNLVKITLVNPAIALLKRSLKNKQGVTRLARRAVLQTLTDDRRRWQTTTEARKQNNTGPTTLCVSGPVIKRKKLTQAKHTAWGQAGRAGWKIFKDFPGPFQCFQGPIYTNVGQTDTTYECNSC